MHPLKVGTEIEKVSSEVGDGHIDGARGRVASVMGPVDVPGFPCRYGYFVKWEDFPIPVFIAGHKVQPVVVLVN